MFVGLGVGVGRQRFAGGIFSAYAARVAADGGVTEAGSCVDAVSTLLQSASLLLVPSGYKSGKVYAEIPTNGNGDLTFARASTANRTNSSGNLELMSTGVPRLDYSQGSCPALLLEPQRTNLALRSEDFDDAYWLKSNITVTANQETSPDGTQNADLFSATSGITSALYRSFTLTAGTSYTFSIYVKKKTVTASTSRFRINFVNNLFVDFNSSVPVITGGSGTIVSSTNGFYRIITTVTPSVASNTLYLYPDGNTNSGDEYYIYGAQLEVGAYATTYIPTTTATATRIADSFSRSNIYTNGLITSSGGTWFVELRNNVVYTGGITQAQLLGLGNDAVGATANNFWIACQTGGTRISLWKQTSGTLNALYITTTDTVKIAIKWNGTNADMFANGIKVVSATSFTTTALESLRTTALQHPYFIQQMALYSSPLSDTDCIQLTTL